MDLKKKSWQEVQKIKYAALYLLGEETYFVFAKKINLSRDEKYLIALVKDCNERIAFLKEKEPSYKEAIEAGIKNCFYKEKHFEGRVTLKKGEITWLCVGHYFDNNELYFSQEGFIEFIPFE